MIANRCVSILACVLALGVVNAGASAGNPYHWTDNDSQGQPDANDGPPNAAPDGTQWKPGGTAIGVTVNKDRKIYVAVTNDNDGGTKSVVVQITCTGGSDLRELAVSSAKGYANNSGANIKGTVQKLASTATQLNLNLSFPECPDWEYVCLESKSKNRSFTGLTVSVKVDACEQVSRAGTGASGDSRPSCACTSTAVQVTEIYNFPESAMLDQAMPATFIAPPESGVWLSEWVAETPDGQPRPQGGIRWFTDGPGLAAGDVYSFGYSMIGAADAQYEVYTYDEATGELASFIRDLRPSVFSWQSQQSTSSSLGMRLDPMARGDNASDAIPAEALLPTVEPRLGGIQQIKIEFNQPIVLINPAAVTVSGLEVEFAPPLVVQDSSSAMLLDFIPDALPDQGAYTINVSGAVADAYNGVDEVVGDTDCSIIALLGDADGDAAVTDADIALIESHLGQPVDDLTIGLDLDGDGVITGADAAIAMDNLGHAVTCPGSFPTVPWFEGFELSEPGAGLHGVCGWKGWDNDPAFDAFVTSAESLDSTNAVVIELAADLVLEYPGEESGQWAYTAWQHIPSTFTSGGSGQFAGSFLILLNSYQDGVHANSDWSVQMQADSTDGMIKVYHGDGLNTISVPIQHDRWVRVRAIIDLDEDWTRVYYDDALISEYPWTGGILGEGGGALDIGAVDLYAGGSSPIYYDDLLLEPIAGCGSALDDDADGDGLTLLDEYLRGTDACLPDTDGDGVVDAADNCPTTFNAEQTDADADGVGDACDDDVMPACPADLTGDSQIGPADLAELLAQWGLCKGLCTADIAPGSGGDGAVGPADLAELLAGWGPCQ